MNKTYFEILRPGINSTIQDKGRNHFYHIGITLSGAMDQRIFMLSNAIVNNSLNEGALEFAYQGPLLKLKNGPISFTITGNVNFNILRKDSKVEKGNCFESYFLEDEDQIDIISTQHTVFGYLSVDGGFVSNKIWNSCSTNTKAEVGPNNGKKFSKNEKIYIKRTSIKNFVKKKIDFTNSIQKDIRVLKGTNFDYFSEESKNKFFKEEYSVTKLSDRMGMRLDGPKLENIVNTNIKSEGLVKGVIQVPADGKPIILFSDHGTIGGYPKIGVVITADHDNSSQLIPGSKIKFREVTLDEAQELFIFYNNEITKYISQIR